MSNPLRNPAINYGDGWFFVTAQVAHNKSQFGVVAGGRCELNELGRRVVACWEGLFERHPEAWRDAWVVMPNHFHAVLRIHARPANKPNHLAYLLQGFKSFTTHEYHAAGIWHGHIRPGGTLETLLRSLPLSPPQSPHPHHSSLS